MEPNAGSLEVFYNTFREISKAVHSSTDLKEVLDLVVCKAAEARAPSCASSTWTPTSWN